MAAIIILVPQHEQFLERLLVNVANSEPEFDEVVVVASGFGPGVWRVKKQVSKTVRNARVLSQPLASAGSNRNAGARSAKSEILVFLDADDAYSLARNQVIRDIFSQTNADLFLHSFLAFTDYQEVFQRFGDPPAAVSSTLLGNESLLPFTFPGGARSRESEISGNSPSTNLLWDRTQGLFEIHHAHCSVRREVARDVSFHEIIGLRNEDGVFARDVLERGFEIKVSPLVLSGYQQGERAKPKQTPMLLLRKKLQRVAESRVKANPSTT